jgi:hypothetical protein
MRNGVVLMYYTTPGNSEQGIVFPAGSNVTDKETLMLNNKEDCVVDFSYSGADA